MLVIINNGESCRKVHRNTWINYHIKTITVIAHIEIWANIREIREVVVLVVVIVIANMLGMLRNCRGLSLWSILIILDSIYIILYVHVNILTCSYNNY